MDETLRSGAAWLLAIAGYILWLRELTKNNETRQRERVAQNVARCWRERATALSKENNAYFSVHLAHLPAKQIARTFKAMGFPGLRLNNVAPDSEWARLKNDPEFAGWVRDGNPNERDIPVSTNLLPAVPDDPAGK